MGHSRQPESPAPSATDDGYIHVRDARVHNLRGIDVDLPRTALVVLTGVSGSGKSSLAFDTVHAEAQRRYLESIAPYARRLLLQAGSPRVGQISGLPPTIALRQRPGSVQARSSVGTLTTLSSTLRMLLSRCGTYPAGMQRLDSDAFSPNTVAGACRDCHGLGVMHEMTEASLVPDPKLSIRERAVAAWPGAWQGKNYRDILAVLGYDVDAPWHTLAQADRDWILFTDEQPVVTVHAERDAHRIQRPYQGTYMSARRYVRTALTMSQSAQQRRRALQYVETHACATCRGTRLRPDALAVRFAGRSIAELGALPLTQLAQLVTPLAASSDTERDAAAVLCRDLASRLQPLCDLGVGYLSLDRAAATLSAGEAQRLRLATQLRSGLFGVVYVLDEPSAGLHPADVEPLLEMLDALVAGGNSLLVVEHDMAIARRADWLVDIGPGAGDAGGRVLHSGPPELITTATESATRQFLLAARSSHAQSEPRTPRGWIELSGITCHNLAGLDTAFPIGVLTAVTGVSGAGKSTLVTQVLGGLVAAHLGCEAHPTDDESEDSSAAAPPRPSMQASAAGLDQVTRLVRVDQRPIGRTPRSNAATYTGVFDAVRRCFAATDDARARGWKPGRFSFNVDGGRCATCHGEGLVAVELMFLPGTWAPCDACGGSRFARETLEVTWRGLSIADVLASTVDEAIETFEGEDRVLRTLHALRDVGLGYLRLGQSATELSGGEAQRVKLATELQRGRRGHTLYLLDEPTTGLHPADVQVLVRQLHRLADAGHTVVLVEHDMDVIASADHVIDLGPGGGVDGGRVIACGSPADIARHPDSRTARYLAPALAR